MSYRVLHLLLIGFFLSTSFAVESSENSRENRSIDLEPRGAFLDKIVPGPVRNLFGSKGKNDTSSAKNSTSEKPEDEDKKEHGTLDFVGRDIIRGVGKTLKSVGESVGFSSSNSSAGLDCDKSFFSGVSDGFKSKVKAIYPGTKWCGDGNKSRSYDDLGTFNDTDSCCREHDLCPNGIAAGESKYGLINTGLFTRSHCDCDTTFYHCLKKTDSIVSTKIGTTFFTVLGPQCFKEEYKIIDCLREDRGKCVEYKYETGGDKIYQWFDSPKY